MSAGIEGVELVLEETPKSGEQKTVVLPVESNDEYGEESTAHDEKRGWPNYLEEKKEENHRDIESGPSESDSYRKSSVRRCSRCLKQVIPEKSITLQACSHNFCKTCPPYLKLQNVEQKVCICCGTCDPSMKDLLILPFIKNLRDPPLVLLELLLCEYIAYRNKEVFAKVKRTQANEINGLKARQAKDIRAAKSFLNSVKDALSKKSSKQSRRAMSSSRTYHEAKTNLERTEKEHKKEMRLLKEQHERSWSTRERRPSTRELEDEQKALTMQTTSTISKHFRRASVKIHPDRYGDKYIKEFESLKEAIAAMKNEKLREKYVRQMVEVLCKVGPGTIPRSHETFVKQHGSDIAEKPQEEGEKKRSAQLQGGLLFHKPKKPGVTIVTGQKIRIMLRPYDDIYQFFRYCIAIQIFGECHDDKDSKEVVLHRIAKNELYRYSKQRDFTDITVELSMPRTGVWSICWSCAMSDGNSKKDTPRSEDAHIEIRTAREDRITKEISSFEEQARKRAIDVRTMVSKFDGKTVTQATRDAVSPVILRATDTMYHLKKLYRSGKRKTSPILEELHGAIKSADTLRKKIEVFIAKSERKEGLRSFKLGVHDLLETGAAASWLSTVTVQELRELKGDANRLYQLLIEGKKAYSIQLVDTETLDTALHRTDLFSSKQLDALLKRRDEVENKAREEAEKAMQEAIEKEKQAKERHDMEERGALMERGTTVVLYGLTNRPEMNGVIGTFMGLADGSRYLVRLQGKDKKEVSLKQENFKAWYGSSFDTSQPTKSPTAKEPKASGTSQATKSSTSKEPKASGTSQATKSSTSKSPISKEPKDTKQGLGLETVSTKAPRNEPFARVMSPLNSYEPAILSQTDRPKEQPVPARAPEKEAFARVMSPFAFYEPAVVAQAERQREEERRGTEMREAAAAQTKQRKEANSTDDFSKDLVSSLSRDGWMTTPAQVVKETEVEGESQQEAANGAISKDEGVISAPDDSEVKDKNQVDRVNGEFVKDERVGSPASDSWMVSPAETVEESEVQRQEADEAVSDKGQTKQEEVKEGVHKEPEKKEAQFRAAGETETEAKEAQIVQSTSVHGVVPTRTDRSPSKTDFEREAAVSDILITEPRGLFSDDAAESDILETEPGRLLTELTDSDVLPTEPKILSKSKATAILKKAAENLRTGPPTRPPEVKKWKRTVAATVPATNTAETLLDFLQSQRSALKSNPLQFGNWLHDHDITTTEDLYHACEDPDFSPTLVSHGVKQFKVSTFKKAIARSCGFEQEDVPIKTSAPVVKSTQKELPRELTCPITREIFEDPVVAMDGVTYERSAITDWFTRQQQDIVNAYDILMHSPDNVSAQVRINEGVVAPSGETITDFKLIPNKTTQIIASDFLAVNPWAG